MRSESSKRIAHAYSKRGMYTNVKRARTAQAVWYDIPYPASAYTFPKEARIKTARFDSDYVHIELTDARVLSIPLRWIPSVYHAAAEERVKYEISRDQQMIVWNPDKCAINDELRITDYLGSTSEAQTTAKETLANATGLSPRHRRRATKT